MPEYNITRRYKAKQLGSNQSWGFVVLGSLLSPCVREAEQEAGLRFPNQELVLQRVSLKQQGNEASPDGFHVLVLDQF